MLHRRLTFLCNEFHFDLYSTIILSYNLIIPSYSYPHLSRSYKRWWSHKITIDNLLKLMRHYSWLSSFFCCFTVACIDGSHPLGIDWENAMNRIGMKTSFTSFQLNLNIILRSSSSVDDAVDANSEVKTVWILNTTQVCVTSGFSISNKTTRDILFCCRRIKLNLHEFSSLNASNNTIPCYPIRREFVNFVLHWNK